MKLPQLRSAIVCSALLLSASMVDSRATAAPDPVDTRHVTIASSVIDMTPDARFAVIDRSDENTVFVVDLQSSAIREVSSRGHLSDDGTTLWSVNGASELVRETVGGAVSTQPNPLAGVPGDWLAISVVATSGDQVIIFGGDGAAGGAAEFTFNPATGVATRRVGRADTSSQNGAWTVFVSTDPTVKPGLENPEPRLFVRHERSGLVNQVPAAGDSSIWQAVVTNKGRVLFRSPATTLQGPGSTTTFQGLQLFAWDGVGVATQLTTGPAGTPPTGPLTDNVAGTSFRVTPDGQTVAVTTFAENLDGSRGGFDAHLYRIELPARGAVNGEAILAPRAKYCVGVHGAEPGDFVVLNVTPVLAGTTGFATIHSSNDQAGDTSSANFGAGTIDPNVAFSKVGDDGQVCITNSKHGPVHVVLDELVVGSSDMLSSPTAGGSARLVDTRTDVPVPPLGTLCFVANGAAGVLTGVNVTPVLATAAGFGVIHSSDESAGSTSNVNFAPGSLDPNIAFARIGADGKICFTNSKHGPVHVIVDQLVNGRSAVFSTPTDDGATRLIDTREGTGGPLGPRERVCVTPVGSAPGGWTGLNITPVEATGPGFGTVHSSDVEPSGTSNVNFDVGTVDPNVAIVEVGVDGKVCFSNSRLSTTHVIIDQLVNATSETFSTPDAGGAKRLADTRLARF